jgi:hydroxymethylpyrimidine/phosphomethylpyrimidine kinase
MMINALTIAGSDSGGGAGIQADLKTFSALGAYGASVITALTAQNTQGVHGIMAVDADFVKRQCEAIFDDIRIDGVKCGMLANLEIIETVMRCLERYHPPLFVLDTVMVAKSGDALLAQDAISALREMLLPLADIITPNLPEAAALLRADVARDEKTMREHGRALLTAGAQAVLIKGGHLQSEESPDWLITSDEEIRFVSPRIAGKHTHGTGCTLSAALTALRPRHQNWSETIDAAKSWMVGAFKQAERLEVGSGIGPLHHYYRWW